MQSDIKKDNIDEELNYWEVEYEAKLSENKINSIKSIIEIFGNYLKSKDYIVQINDLVCLASSVDCEIKIYPQYDYKKEPNKPKRIQITKRDFVNKTENEFLIGIFNNTPLLEPDLNRLLENPYKGLSIVEIELLEKSKSIKFFKEYVSKQETNKFVEYHAVNLTIQQDLGIGKIILKLLEIILE